MGSEYTFESEAARRFPPYLMFDVSAICDLACTHCPQFELKTIVKPSEYFLTEELFRKAIDEAIEGKPDFVRITGNGEPLLHPLIVEFIEYAKSKLSCPITLTTNGNRLFPDVSDRLLSARIDMIDISVDAYTRETYECIRIKGDYDKLMSNVNALLERKKRNKAKTKIVLSFVEQEKNRDELDKFVSYWECKVDEVLIRKLHTMGGKVPHSPSSEEVERFPCAHLWKRIIVEHSGKLAYCPVDMFGRSTVGDLKEHTIAEVWTGEVYAKLREAHLLNCYDGYSLCGSCTDWITTPWNYGYDNFVRKITGN